MPSSRHRLCLVAQPGGNRLYELLPRHMSRERRPKCFQWVQTARTLLRGVSPAVTSIFVTPEMETLFLPGTTDVSPGDRPVSTSIVGSVAHLHELSSHVRLLRPTGGGETTR